MVRVIKVAKDEPKRRTVVPAKDTEGTEFAIVSHDPADQGGWRQVRAGLCCGVRDQDDPR